jgi:hypothetical protein
LGIEIDKFRPSGPIFFIADKFHPDRPSDFSGGFVFLVERGGWRKVFFSGKDFLY